MSSAVLLVSHGSVDALDELAAFVTSVRRGHPAAPEVVAELRRRYEAIGGRSPLNAVNAELAAKLARRTGLRVALANRLWKPFVRDVVAELARAGVRRLAVVPLAQHSGPVYADDARRAAEGTGVDVRCAPSWGRDPALVAAFASRIAATLAAAPDPDRATLVMTAHSLPRSVIDAGDPYERDVRGAAGDIESAVQARTGRTPRTIVAFQSQGLSTGPGGRPVEWLGPDLRSAIALAAERGDTHVVFAPVGFLADHVEVLYDLDIEARAMAAERGLSYARVPSLDADEDLVEILAVLARPLLADG
jgi:ferrochelatase